MAYESKNELNDWTNSQLMRNDPDHIASMVGVWH